MGNKVSYVAVRVNLVNSARFRITMETNVLAHLSQIFYIKLVEMGRPTLKMSITLSWVGVPDGIKRRKQIGHKHPTLPTS